MKKLLFLLVFFSTIFSYDLHELSHQAKKHLEKKEYNQALACYQQLYNHFPNDHNIIHAVGYLMRQEYHMHEAISFYEKVLPQFPISPQLNLGYAFACLSCGEYQKAWPSYEYRWKQPPPYNATFRNFFSLRQAPNYAKATMGRQGDRMSLANKRIVLKTEFGLGDSMQFIRYAKELKKLDAYIIVECHHPLEKLFSLCPYIDEVIPADNPLPAHDFYTLLMSMPFVFNTSLKTIPTDFPYLYADKKRVNYWHEKIKDDTNFKIGICWSTDLVSPDKIINEEKNKKNIPLSLFAQLKKINNVSLYSLQKNIDKNACKKYNIIYFDDFDKTHGSFMDSAALIENLDLIITMDTSVAHLAGALNKPVWVLLPKNCDWRWLLKGEKTNWYPSMTLFRQSKPGDWYKVIENVFNTLSQLI